MANQKLTSDIYDIVKFVNDLKASYIETDNEDTLYASTFGYMGEAFSSLLQNSIIMSSEYSNEVIATRAKFDRNVLIHAKSLGISKIEATPATMPILLCIPESNVLNNLKNSPYTVEDQCLLDCSFPLIIEGKEFHLNNDIIITRVENDALQLENKVAYTAEYRLPDGSTDNKYLPTIGIFKMNDLDNMLILTTSVKQIMYSEIEENIISDNSITNKTLNFKFTNQLVDFDVVVYEGNADKPSVILTPVYDGLYNTEEKYCWYSYMNADTIRIRFDENSYRPRINSKVIIRLRTTLGTGGNFKYVDDVNLSFNNTTTTKYTGMDIVIKQRGEGAVGGLDRASVEQLRRVIPKERLSRGSVTTLTDLRNFFNSFNTEDSTIHVFRKEDNILTRVYYAYALMKDEDSNVIPTNTIPIKISSKKINTTNKKLFIEAGTQILYNRENSSTYIGKVVENNVGTTVRPSEPFKPNTILDLKIKGMAKSWTVKVEGSTISNSSGNNGRLRIIPIYTKEFLDYHSREDVPPFPEEITYNQIEGYRILDGFLYTLPYSIAIYDPDSAGEGRPNCSYFIDSLNETHYLNFNYINSNSDIQFIASSVRLVRPSYLSVNRYNYTLSIQLTPNTGSTTHVDSRFVQCIAIIYNKGSKDPIGYSIGELQPQTPDNTAYFTYNFSFNTKPLDATEDERDDNTLTEDNRIWIEGLYAPGVNDDNQYQKEIKYLTEEIDVKIFTLYNYTAPDVDNMPTNQRVPDELSTELYSTVASNFGFEYSNPTPEDKDNTDFYTLSDMTITNMYTPMTSVHLFYNYSERLSSYVSVQRRMNELVYIINRVPVVRYFYFSTEDRVERFVTEIKKKLIYIDMAIDPLETLFGIDFKLFNTYGPSNMYKVTDKGLPDRLIDRVNLTLNFRTEMYSNSDRSIVNQIKNDIKEYVEDIQQLKDLHMPNLITQITQKYKDHLVYFEFLGFSNGIVQWGSDYQHIITDESLDMLTVVPEFLNVNFNDETGEPDINIDVVG